MTNIIIRKMTPADKQAALAILSEWNMAPQEPDENIPETERSDIIIENSIVAVDDGKVVGVASYIIHSPDHAETASMAVSPSYKGLGIGYNLQKTRLHEMKAMGIKTVTTESDRSEVIDWYIRKFGYRIIGTNAKKHDFSLPDVNYWTVLELKLENWND